MVWMVFFWIYFYTHRLCHQEINYFCHPHSFDVNNFHMKLMLWSRTAKIQTSKIHFSATVDTFLSVVDEWSVVKFVKVSDQQSIQMYLTIGLYPLIRWTCTGWYRAHYFGSWYQHTFQRSHDKSPQFIPGDLCQSFTADGVGLSLIWPTSQNMSKTSCSAVTPYCYHLSLQPNHSCPMPPPPTTNYRLVELRLQ